LYNLTGIANFPKRINYTTDTTIDNNFYWYISFGGLFINSIFKWSVRSWCPNINDKDLFSNTIT